MLDQAATPSRLAPAFQSRSWKDAKAVTGVSMRMWVKRGRQKLSGAAHAPSVFAHCPSDAVRPQPNPDIWALDEATSAWTQKVEAAITGQPSNTR